MSLKFTFWTLYFMLFSFCFSVKAEKKEKPKKYKPIIVNPILPDTIYESSGLIWLKSKLWTFNDGGNATCIYALDEHAKKVLQTICISNASNIDWEAITMDEQYIYIADIGNNKGSRNAFKVYKIKNDFPEKDPITIEAEVINYTYKDFRNKKFQLYSSWDAEAIVCIRDTLVIFNKNWQEPQCYIYFLPVEPGNYELKPAKRIPIDGLVTDASYNKNTKSLIMIGYKDLVPFMYHFKNFDLNNINLRKVKRYNFEQLLGVQMEGVTFINDTTLFLSSEYNPAINGALHKIYIEK